MSLAENITHTRLLPGSVQSGLKNGALRFIGMLCLVGAVAGWMSLGSWSVTDPSMQNLTDAPMQNLLGYYGASVSNLLFQIFGLASIWVFLPLASWGWHLLALKRPDHSVVRLLMWPLSVILLAGALSNISRTETWPLPNGIGGWVGDQVLSYTSTMMSWVGLVPEMTIVLNALLLPAIGMWAATAAAAITLADFSMMIFGKVEKIKAQRSASLANTSISDVVSKLESFEASTPVRPASPSEGNVQAVPKAGNVTRASIPVVGSISGGRIEPKVSGSVFSEKSAPTPTPTPQIAKPQAPQQQIPQEIPMASAMSNVTAPTVQAQPVSNVVVPSMAEEPVAQEKTKSIFNFFSQNPVPEAIPDTLAYQSRPGLPAPGNFALPTLDFLTSAPREATEIQVADEVLHAECRRLEEVLSDFGVKGKIVNARPGPVVTLFELEPARGVKSARIIGLTDDIARYMSAVSARIAVIPGQNLIGIELPNKSRQIVYMREQLESQAAHMSNYRLPMILGKNIGGESVAVDLAAMPHLLIAGTTGSGKSVGINTMILSLLYNMTPEQCKFIMIDPKMLELSVYEGIPHLLSPVVTDPKKAVFALKWTVKEMEERYKKMSKMGVRNIGGFNNKVETATNKGQYMTRTVQTGFDADTGEAIYETETLEYEKMPFIVVVVDEMADLMVCAGKEIEGAVQRLAQMARAAGIHIIMATQRPSVDVITGTIKANFPSRMSFQVTSKIDSRTIIGEMGAEQLLGKGDMLYMKSGGRVERVHGAFVSDEEVEEITRYLKAQGTPHYLDAVTEGEEEEEVEAPTPTSTKQDKNEALYDEAIAIVLRDKKASTSYIQRRLSIGYNKAASIIDRMEDEGLISQADHVGRREILMRTDEDAQMGDMI